MVTRTLRGFRRSPAAGHTRNYRICERFPHVGQRHPRCPSNGRRSSGPGRTQNQRLDWAPRGARGMRDYVWKLIGYSSVSGFSCRTWSADDGQRSCCCPCSRRSVCPAVFWPRKLPRGPAQRRPTAGIGGPARRSRSVAQQQELAPTRTAGMSLSPLVVETSYSITRSAPPSSPMSSVSSRPKWACCP